MCLKIFLHLNRTKQHGIFRLCCSRDSAVTQVRAWATPRARQKRRTSFGNETLGLYTSSDKAEVKALFNAYRSRKFEFYTLSTKWKRWWACPRPRPCIILDECLQPPESIQGFTNFFVRNCFTSIVCIKPASAKTFVKLFVCIRSSVHCLQSAL